MYNVLHTGLCELALGRGGESLTAFMDIVGRMNERGGIRCGSLEDQKALDLSLLHVHLLAELCGIGDKVRVERILQKRLRNLPSRTIGDAPQYTTVLVLLYAGEVDESEAQAYLSEWTRIAPCSEEAQFGSHLLSAWELLNSKEVDAGRASSLLQNGIARALQSSRP